MSSLITLDTINTIILDKHNVDLHNLKVRRSTNDQTLFRRCFVNLATRYTEAKPPEIKRYLNLNYHMVQHYRNTIDTLTYNPYYNQVYAELIVVLNKVRQDNGVYNDKVDRALQRIDELDKEITMLRKQISEIKYG